MTIPSEPAFDAASGSRAESAAPPTNADLLEHEYDGIREYDNPLPRWWVWSFAASFVFALGYFFHYHVSHNGTSVADEYQAEVAEAQAIEAKRSLAAPVTDASLGGLMSDAPSMTEAKALFELRCSPCHGEQAQGIIGPNLTDNAWLHGQGRLLDIYRVVENGVLDKGMPAWGRQLTPSELRKVVAFVGTQRGKNIPGKAPQGAAIE